MGIGIIKNVRKWLKEITYLKKLCTLNLWIFKMFHTDVPENSERTVASLRAEQFVDTADYLKQTIKLDLGGARKKAGVASKSSSIGQGLSRHTVPHRQGQK